MSEFKLHHLVLELTELLESSVPPEQQNIEKLQRGIATPENVPTLACLKHLVKNARDPELFVQKYEQLKAKKIDGLGAFMELLRRITADKSMKEYLAKSGTAETRSGAVAKTGLTITKEDLPLIRKNIMKAAVEGERKLNRCGGWAGRRYGSGSYDPSSTKQNWVTERPRISWDFYADTSGFPQYEKVVPSVSQETLVIWDLLRCLKGTDGAYIVSEPTSGLEQVKTFGMNPDISISLKQLAQQILPLASHYSMTVRFVEEKVLPDDGQVNHALRGALSCLLRDYLSFVVQLEMQHVRGKLNLQKMWFYVQPTMATMSILSQITSNICKANARGGKVLSLLHDRVNDMSGDAKCKELGLFLIQAASVPYMQTLEKWVYKGVICDPYQEFLVEDNELIQREELPMDYSADYWEKRYAMRPERIPVFLNDHAQTILRTGKYFNVIRQCGKTVQWGKQEPLVYQHREQKFIAAIDRAYSEAAKTLLEVLINENDLMGRLRSVKNYFLLAQGDFVVQFLNLCESELSKNMYDIVIHRLASLLEVALRTSTADSDPYKDDLKPELLPYDLQFQMFRILSIQTRDEKEYCYQAEKPLTGLEAFVFNYDVKWPVSLVINRKAIACYQMLFRHLLYCKHVERLLCRVWISNKIAKTFTHEAAMAYRQAFSVRQRMLDCIQHLEYYMMVEVIEPNWLTFINKMNKVSNVDDVLSVHQDLQDSYLKECMLTDPDLLGCITALCTVCVEFCDFMQRMSRYFIDAELTSMISACQDDGYEPEHETTNSKTKNNNDGITTGTVAAATVTAAAAAAAAASFESTIETLDSRFTDVLIRLLDRICDLGCDNNNEKLLNVLCRLDFNLFYTDMLRHRGRGKPGSERNEASG